MKSPVLMTVMLVLVPLGAALAPQESEDRFLQAAQAHARKDLSGAERHRVFVPAGHALQGTFTPEGVVLEPVPLRQQSLAETSDCLIAADLANEYWVPRNPNYPRPNLASQGECYYQVQTDRIAAFTFLTTVAGYADAWNLNNGDYFYVYCETGLALGTPVTTQFEGLYCETYQEGGSPFGYARWDSKVVQAAGTTFIEWRHA